MTGRPVAVACVLTILLIILNVRGVKESVTVLAPIFMVFVVTHIIMLVYGVFIHSDRLAPVVSDFGAGIHRDVSTIGVFGIILLFLRAYSLGGGTYTGIEAVSNGLQIMRCRREKGPWSTWRPRSPSLPGYCSFATSS